MKMFLNVFCKDQNTWHVLCLVCKWFSLLDRVSWFLILNFGSADGDRNFFSRKPQNWKTEGRTNDFWSVIMMKLILHWFSLYVYLLNDSVNLTLNVTWRCTGSLLRKDSEDRWMLCYVCVVGVMCVYLAACLFCSRRVEVRSSWACRKCWAASELQPPPATETSIKTPALSSQTGPWPCAALWQRSGLSFHFVILSLTSRVTRVKCFSSEGKKQTCNKKNRWILLCLIVWVQLQSNLDMFLNVSNLNVLKRIRIYWSRVIIWWVDRLTDRLMIDR